MLMAGEMAAALASQIEEVEHGQEQKSDLVDVQGLLMAMVRVGTFLDLIPLLRGIITIIMAKVMVKGES